MLNPSTDTDDNDFVLKHRIAGAAFLLFFGALVLPWMLGPPSEADKPEEVVELDVKASEEYVPQDLEDEILAQLKEEVEGDETVYISKVTPSGFSKVSEVSERSAAEQKKLDDKKKAEQLAAQQLADKKKQQAKLEQQKADKLKADKEKAAEKNALAKAEAEKKKLAEKKQAAEKKTQVSVDKDEEKAPATLSEEERKRIAAKQLADALEAEAKNTASNKSGWIVQVGVFTDKSGAKKVSDSLIENGFKPSSTVVDTNLGLGTGTRVWLGPFSSRDEAGKVKANLADKTGSSGFVRAYP